MILSAGFLFQFYLDKNSKVSSEEFARRIIQSELRCTVVINDDGTEHGMYDLRIGQSRAPEIAIECVGAVDPTYTETWNIGPAKGPFQLNVHGDYHVVISAETRLKALMRSLQAILLELESKDLSNVHVDHRLARHDRELHAKLEAHRIQHVLRFTAHGSGFVYLGMQGNGGAIDEHGRAVPPWIGEFLRDPACQDVLNKLCRSGAKEHHAFVTVGTHGSPWEVESYLMEGLKYLPDQCPDLPSPVAQVWIVPPIGEKGLRWNGAKWKRFDLILAADEA